ncbi:hypothetical protein [Sediminibacterium sp.]|uniref:hypothetical protein n=1 Tax=Sediminibacterium sp. TaxID=1917865 RepID=UPI0025EB94C4|nr:hypothetical protein [Sediminibacterium sp.]
MKKFIFPIIAVFTLTAAFITIDASSQVGPGEEGGKVDCYGRYTTGGTENFTQCNNGCTMVYNQSSPSDKSTCRP